MVGGSPETSLTSGNVLEECLNVNIEAGLHVIAEVDEDFFHNMTLDSCTGSFFHVYFSYRRPTEGQGVENSRHGSSFDQTDTPETMVGMPMMVTNGNPVMTPSVEDIGEGNNTLAMELYRGRHTQLSGYFDANHAMLFGHVLFRIH